MRSGDAVVSAVGALLAGVVAGGTGCYIAGIAPPFPWNLWAFNGLLWLCVLYALVLGRSR